MQRVHAHGVAARLGGAAAAGCLQHAQLRLQLRDVAAEGLERLAHAVRVETVAAARQSSTRKRGQLRRVGALGSMKVT